MKGIWFFGLSGSGKTYASKYLKKKIKKSIIIDGDQVRKFVSFDLSYTKKDRLIQIRRVLGLAIILTKQGYFPIISTVFFNNEVFKICREHRIMPFKILRSDIKNIINSHPTYKNKKNVVGKDISYEKIKTKKIINDGRKNFCKALNLSIL
jgi:adenylylsulfate kinase-like enzyme